MRKEKLEHGEKKEFKHYDIEFDKVFFKYDEKDIIEKFYLVVFMFSSVLRFV